MGTDAIGSRCVRRDGAMSRTAGSLEAFYRLVQLWRFRRRSRRALIHMDDRMMRDIGLDPLDVVAEYRKPFWRP